VLLDDPMELERLTSGDLERGITMLVGYPIDREPLSGSDDPAGESTADHECVGGFEALGFERVADVAVVLSEHER